MLDLLYPRLAPVPPVAATISVSVPEVATTAGDGLPARLRPGRVRIDVPALLTVPDVTRPAWLEVNGRHGPSTVLTPGATARVRTAFDARPGATVTVRLVAGGTVVSVWHHTVRG